jgi:hypothetical protein
MKKSDREIVYNKFGGRCAYCGYQLQKGWHVDELKPVRRSRKWEQGYWRHKVTKQPKPKDGSVSIMNEEAMKDYEYVESRWVSDGCMHPENFNIDNQNPSCASCNINKHSGSLEEFRQLIQGFMKHLNEINTQYKIAKRYGLVKEEIKPVVFYFETLNNKAPAN